MSLCGSKNSHFFLLANTCYNLLEGGRYIENGQNNRVGQFLFTQKGEQAKAFELRTRVGAIRK